MTSNAAGPHIPGLEGFELIGWGGFGAVFRAWQPSLNRHVAVKVLSTASLDEQVRRRFDREQRAMGSLSAHPAIVTLHGSGFTDEGLPYLVMEHMEGGALADWLVTQGAMGWPQAVDITVRIAGAVEEAHRAGVLHRDIKPENILMSRYGEPKLTDFGIAALMEGSATATTSVTATVEHAAPEVLGGKPPTVVADIYSLASTLFALMAGHSPFRHSPDESILPILGRVANEAVPDLRGRGVPDPVCRAVEAGLAKNPADRPTSAAAFATMLRLAAEQAGAAPQPFIAPPTEVVIPAVAATESADSPRKADTGQTRLLSREPETPEPAAEPEPEPARRRWWPLAAAALLLLAGTAAALFVFLGGDDDHTAAPTSTSLPSTSSSIPAVVTTTQTTTTATHATTTTTTTSATTTTTSRATTTTATTSTTTSTTVPPTTPPTPPPTVTVTRPPVDPWVTVRPGSGTTTTAFSITVGGLTPSGPYRLEFWDGAEAHVRPILATATPSGAGAMVHSFSWGSGQTPGRYRVRVTDLDSGESDSAGFTITETTTTTTSP